MNFKKIVISILFSVLLYSLQANTNLIPQPQEISFGDNAFQFSSLAISGDNEFENEVKQFSNFLTENGIGQNHPGSIQVIIQKGEVKNLYGYDGAYRLSVSKNIVIQSLTAKGIFYAFQTLKQLIEKASDGFAVPECEINDWPAFKI